MIGSRQFFGTIFSEVTIRQTLKRFKGRFLSLEKLLMQSSRFELHSLQCIQSSANRLTRVGVQSSCDGDLRNGFWNSRGGQLHCPVIFIWRCGTLWNCRDR